MPLLTDKNAIFALGLLGAVGYYGLKAALRKTVVVLMPHSVHSSTDRYQSFINGMTEACRHTNCMLHYLCIPDLYHRYDALLSALTSSQLKGCPVVCRVLDEHMLAVLEQSGSRFVAVMSPAWVSKSVAHVASIRPWDMSDLPADHVVITSHDEWIPGASIARPETLMHVAVALSKQQQARHLLIADYQSLVLSNRSAGKLVHMFKSVKLLEGPSFSDGYEAITKAVNVT